MGLNPATYEEALQRARSKPQKPRPPLRSRSGLTASEWERARQQSLLRNLAKKPKRKKKLTTGQLKKRAWKEFSIWVRTWNADEYGMATCFTCDVVKHWKEMQAGHFIRGRLNGNLFDERGCHPQCLRCNIHLQGNVVIYYQRMLYHYGQEAIDDLVRQNDQTHKWLPGELQSIWEKYRERNTLNPLLREGEQ